MRSLSGALPVLAVMLALSFMPGCSKLGQLKAMKAFKEANTAYRQQDFKKAGQLYEETVQADPNQGIAYFFLANSYDQMYKPSKKGEAENDALLTKAAQNYQTCAEKLAGSANADEKVYGRRALEYLVAVYGPDKLNDPAKAEPIVQRMIQLEPGEPTNYFALAKIYEDAGAYDNAEQILVKAKEAKPNDPTVYVTLAGYYNRQGRFDKTIEALEQRAAREPNNPEAFHTIATYYWDEVYRDFRLKEPEKKDFIQKGIKAVDRALQIKPDYIEALVYKGLLYRLQANVEKDPKVQQNLIKQADQFRDKALELKKQKASGVGD